MPPLTHPSNEVTLGTRGSGGEAFDFICLQKFCAFECGHISAKSFEEFSLLRSRDTGWDQRMKFSGEGRGAR